MLLTPGAQGEKRPSIEELTNFALGSDYSHWLVGPMSRIASAKEIQTFLSLTDDQAAAEFVEDFWDKRADPSTPWPDEQPRAIFESRASDADRQFTQGVRLGRRTDRGEIYIVYGPPAEIDYESEPDEAEPIEVWEYGKKAEPGLDGEKPKKLYRFIDRDGLTVFYAPAPSRRRRPSLEEQWRER